MQRLVLWAVRNGLLTTMSRDAWPQIHSRSVSEYSLRPTDVHNAHCAMIRLALHCLHLCSLAVSIMTNSVFLGQAHSWALGSGPGSLEPEQGLRALGRGGGTWSQPTPRDRRWSVVGGCWATRASPRTPPARGRRWLWPGPQSRRSAGRCYERPRWPGGRTL